MRYKFWFNRFKSTLDFGWKPRPLLNSIRTRILAFVTDGDSKGVRVP